MASISISTTRSPPKGDDQGILGRFLRRAKSTKGITRSRWGPSAAQQDNISAQRLTAVAEGALSDLGLYGDVDEPASQQLPDQRRHSASATLPQIQPQPHQQRLPRGQATTPEMLTEMAQPRLKKKASIRDRLKSWQKPTQSTTFATKTSPSPSEQPKRFVYQPKHAAADFSRIVISTPAPAPASRRNAKQSFDEDSTLSPSLERVDARHALPVSEDVADLVKSQRASPPLQTLLENEIVADDQAQTRHGEQGDDSTSNGAQGVALQRSRSGARRPYKMAEDPRMAAQAAAHVPIRTLPVRSMSAKNRQPTPHQPDDMAEPLIEEQESSAAKEPLSDFAVFLARAEADDRAHREQILRSFSHHSAFQSPNYVRPNPHRQFAKVGGGDLSGTTVAPGLVSAGGSRSSRGGSHRTSGQYALSGSEDQYQPRARHKRHSSWTPSFGADSDKIEISPEKGGSSTWGPPQGSTPRSPRPLSPQPQKVMYSVNGSFKQAEQPRTLRRQASITQRIAEYIKPPAAGSSEQTLYHSAGRAGLGRTGSQRQPRGVETLLE